MAMDTIASQVQTVLSSHYVVGVCTPVVGGQSSLTIRIGYGDIVMERQISYSAEQLNGDLHNCDPEVVAGHVSPVCEAETSLCDGSAVIHCNVWGTEADIQDCADEGGTCMAGACVPTICGDGRVDPTEACDDGNADDDDQCTNVCTVAQCGDGIVGPGETCDEGQANGDGACTQACTWFALCGNGILEPGENCDDGNDSDDDWCSNTCVSLTDPELSIATLVSENFQFGLGVMNLCHQRRCDGDNCPTVEDGRVQLNGRWNALCLPTIPLGKRSAIMEHTFTLNAHDGLSGVVLRDWPAEQWRIRLNFRDNQIEYQSPANSRRTVVDADLSDFRGEHQWRVVLDATRQQAFVIADGHYIGAVTLPVERLDNFMWSTHGTNNARERAELTNYRVNSFQ